MFKHLTINKLFLYIFYYRKRKLKNILCQSISTKKYNIVHKRPKIMTKYFPWMKKESLKHSTWFYIVWQFIMWHIIIWKWVKTPRHCNNNETQSWSFPRWLTNILSTVLQLLTIYVKSVGNLSNYGYNMSTSLSYMHLQILQQIHY